MTIRTLLVASATALLALAAQAVDQLLWTDEP